MSGTEGKSYRLEAIRIKMNIENMGITYQTHIQNIGWEDQSGRGWKSDREMSGTAGYSYRLEAILIIIQKKGSSPPGCLTMEA